MVPHLLASLLVGSATTLQEQRTLSTTAREGLCEVAALAARRSVLQGEARRVTIQARKESNMQHGSDLQWCSRRCRWARR